MCSISLMLLVLVFAGRESARVIALASEGVLATPAAAAERNCLREIVGMFGLVFFTVLAGVRFSHLLS